MAIGRLGRSRRDDNDHRSLRWSSGGLETAMSAGLILFLMLCVVGGGSNLPSAPGLILIRPAGAFLIAACLITLGRGDRSMRIPILLMAGLTLSIAIQLIPLPPVIWWMLPGRSDLAGLASIGLGEAVWRPMSLAPTLTWNSLLSTLTAWAVMLAFSRMSRDRDRVFVAVIILAALASCFVGLLQLIGGAGSHFYFYDSDGSISGLLANRNHQATLLAITLPLLRVWAVQANKETRLIRGLIAALMGGLLLGMLFLTGSRSGLICGLVGMAAVYLIAPVRRQGTDGPTTVGVVMRWGIFILPFLLVALLFVAGRDLSVQRIFSSEYAGEIRVRSMPTSFSLLKAYFPFGSGYGTFDTVFRIAEPDSLLNPTFFNRAHNDYLELAITGGLLPILLLAFGMMWVARLGWKIIVQQSWQENGVLEGRAGAVILLILALASLSDYPLRAPLMTAIATIAVCWLARAATLSNQDTDN